MKKMFSNKYFRFSFILIVGIFLGWLFFHSAGKNEEKPEIAIETVKSTVWTCSMDPQIRMSEPGKCPVCGMDLIPLVQNNTATDPDAIHLSKDAAQLSSLQLS
jgi:Cu(I)/Ag(I) efflux system membrane fusion protein